MISNINKPADKEITIEDLNTIQQIHALEMVISNAACFTFGGLLGYALETIIRVML